LSAFARPNSANSPTDTPINRAVAVAAVVVADVVAQASPKDPAILPRSHPMKKADVVKVAAVAVTKPRTTVS